MEPSELDESYLTVADVAQLLKLNQQTVRNWIDQGSLPAVRVGRRVRIKRSDLARVLEDGYSGAGGATRRDSGPSAEDFWSGEAVGVAEPGPLDEPALAAEPAAGPAPPTAEAADDRTLTNRGH